MLDLIVKNANLPDGSAGVDIGVRDGRIAEIASGIDAEAREYIDAGGNLASPPFVDSHFHLDSALSLGQPRFNETGTLLEGIAIWSETKSLITAEDIESRAFELCRWAIANGTLAIRSHVDICDDSLLAVETLLKLRRELKPYIDIQLVAFPQDGYLRSGNARENLGRALDRGVDVVGGIPHFERTAGDGTTSIVELCRIAAERALRIDMHCDESDDPQSRHIEVLAAETKRLGLEGRVAGSHLTSMHSMDNYYASKLIRLMLEAEIHVIANPLINITLQGRHDSYPKRRGMTRVKELMAAGVNTAFGHDCVMDPWYSLGRHDMLEVAFMGLHVGQMTGRDEMRRIFDAITVNGAAALGLEDYGLAVGKRADMVILQASDPIEALRLGATRLFVIRSGKIIASAAPSVSKITLDDRAYDVDFRSSR